MIAPSGRSWFKIRFKIFPLTLFTTLPRSAQHVSALGLSSKKANAVHETTNFVLSFTAANTADFRLGPRAEGVGTDAAASPALARVLVRVARDMGVDKIATRVLSKSGSSTRRVRSTFVFEREVTARAGSLLSVEESLAIVVVGDGCARAAIMQPTDARWCDDCAGFIRLIEKQSMDFWCRHSITQLKAG